MSTICGKYFSIKRKNIDMTTVERIKKLAKERGLSLQQAAEKAGIGINSIYRWDKVTPSSNSLEKVANILHTTTDYLLGRTDDPTIPNNSENHINSNTLTWLDLDMPYGGSVPDELKDYYKAMAEQYIKQHPEILKKRDDK